GSTPAELLALIDDAGVSSANGWYYDPSDSSKLYSDTAATTPISGLNDPVAAVADLLGGDPAVQSDADLRPLFTANPLFGQRGLEFDGDDDLLSLTAPLDSGNRSMTVIMAVAIEPDG